MRRGAQGWVSLSPNSNMHVCFYTCMCLHAWLPHESLLRSTVFAIVLSSQQISSEAQITIIMMHDNENWWKFFTTLSFSKDPEDPQLLFKTFISPFNCTSSQRRQSNKYRWFHHSGHRSKLNQVFKPSLSSSSPSRAPGSALHHLKNPWEFLINATGFKWSPGTAWWRVLSVQLEAAHFAFQENSLVTKTMTLCSLIAPLGMRMEKKKSEGKAKGWGGGQNEERQNRKLFSHV